MKLYFAPLEGITTYTYRNVHAEMFGGCDSYFAPFITPSDNEKISEKELRDIHPDNNPSIDIKVQLLSNQAGSFLNFSKRIKALGYDEINLNFGCPSGTVIKKGRGSGFLKTPDKIDVFLHEIIEKSAMTISAKTRIGFWAAEEFEELLKVYNRHKLSLLTVHPRTREDFYNGTPSIDAFKKAYENSTNKICYNGNIFSKGDYEEIIARFPDIDSVMIGRGAIANPAIFREIKGGEKLTIKELLEFTERLSEKYLELLQSETFTLYKLKEIWMFVMWNYPDEKKTLKAIKKSNNLTDFKNAINQLK